MAEPIAPKPRGEFTEIDIRTYIPEGMFKEREYREALRREDWERYAGQRILIKSCQAGPVPPWAFMLLLAQLIPHPRMVAYGEACNPVVVYKKAE